jgi:uncharacterized protein YjlB
MEGEVRTLGIVDYVLLTDDGTFPNNPRLPLLKYSGALKPEGDDPASVFEECFHSHRWGGSWRNGVYGMHHYHSSAHEVLGVYCGSAEIQLGGEQGVRVEVAAGDVVVIPAGVAHKRIRSSPDFGVVGAYPEGQRWDMCYGKKGERPATDRNIVRVPDPETDPVYGGEGPLLKLWSASRRG